MATLTTPELLDVFKNMTVLELNDFLKAFEEEFGVTAAAPVAVAAAPAAGGGGGDAGAAEEKDEFDVILDRRRRQEDPGHQGGPGDRRGPRPEGSQGPRRRRPQAGAREGLEGRRREGEGAARRGRRHRHPQVVRRAGPSGARDRQKVAIGCIRATGRYLLRCRARADGVKPMAMRIPKVRYADADGVSIAYEVRGDGTARRRAHLGRLPEHPRRAIVPTFDQGDDALADFARVIVVDRRGTGMSDPLSRGIGGAARAAGRRHRRGHGRRRLGTSASSGVPPTAGRWPCCSPPCTRSARRRWCSRTRSHGGSARRPSVRPGRGAARAPRRGGAPALGRPREPVGHHDRRAEPAGRPGVPGAATRSCSRSAPAGPRRRRRSSRPGNDIRAVLPLIQARTLVVVPAETPFGVDRARFLADLIPHADVATFPGTDMLESSIGALAIIEEFVTGAPPTPVERPGAGHGAVHRHRVVDRSARRRSATAAWRTRARPSRRDGP